MWDRAGRYARKVDRKQIQRHRLLGRAGDFGLLVVVTGYFGLVSSVVLT